MKDSEVLIAARNLITDPDHWTTGAVARAGNGVPVASYDPQAVQWCAAGALELVCYRTGQPHGQPHLTRLLDLLNLVALSVHSVVVDNDKHGHEQVMLDYDLAIKLALEAES